MSILIPRAEDLLGSRPGLSEADLIEFGRARSNTATHAAAESTASIEGLRWVSAGIVEKWDPDQVEAAKKAAGKNGRLEREDLYTHVGEPTEITEDPPSNLLCNNGINRLLNLLIGTASIVGYTVATSARIGVGNDNTAAAAANTDLTAAAGSSNRYFQTCAASYPQVSAQTLTAQSTFGTADGNFAWQEWGIDGNGASGTTVGINDATHAALLNHKVASLGTKVSGASWTFTVTIVVS